ncbi:MAG: DUF3298 and DUF4163 domain-containing protein [Saprospiraceae bacterium]|nr:DUF3298 and DUF4163 domain-containing protein [Saprospiraceae bacterium]
MRYFIYILFLSFLTLGACENGPQNIPPPMDSGEAETDSPFFTFSFQESSPACETSDSIRCARVNVSMQLLKGKDNPAVESINSQVRAIAYEELSELTEVNSAEADLTKAAKTFVLEYEEMMADEEPEFITPWSVDVESEVLYHSDLLYSIELNNYNYTGGAHPNYYTTLRTFSLKDGTVVKLEKLIQKPAVFLQLVEQAFRAEQEIPEGQDLAESGFFFEEAFSLPANMAFVGDGVLFIYNPYEVAPYALGITEFVIPYAKLEGVLDLGIVGK